MKPCRPCINFYIKSFSSGGRELPSRFQNQARINN